LLIGVYEKKELIFAGKVGTGFDRAEAARLVKRLEPLSQKTPPFKSVSNLARRRAIWVKPKLGANQLHRMDRWKFVAASFVSRIARGQARRADHPREEEASEPEGSRTHQIRRLDAGGATDSRTKSDRYFRRL
jgi:hypothetical protein